MADPDDDDIFGPADDDISLDDDVLLDSDPFALDEEDSNESSAGETDSGGMVNPVDFSKPDEDVEATDDPLDLSKDDPDVEDVGLIDEDDPFAFDDDTLESDDDAVSLDADLSEDDAALAAQAVAERKKKSDQFMFVVGGLFVIVIAVIGYFQFAPTTTETAAPPPPVPLAQVQSSEQQPEPIDPPENFSPRTDLPEPLPAPDSFGFDDFEFTEFSPGSGLDASALPVASTRPTNDVLDRLGTLDVKVIGLREDIETLQQAMDGPSQQQAVLVDERLQAMNETVTQNMAMLEGSLESLKDSMAEMSMQISQLRSQMEEIENTQAVVEQARSTTREIMTRGLDNKQVTRQWVLRAATSTSAWISRPGSSDLKRIGVGDAVDMVGEIESIRKEGDRWLIEGSRALIMQ